jgi:TPR repeat protein
MKICRVVLLCLFAAGCAAGPGKASFDNDERLRLTTAAEQGDREAQYQLGNAYCCGAAGGFWDTAEAVTWWCRAAAQGQADAAAALLRTGRTCSVPAASVAPPPRSGQ